MTAAASANRDASTAWKGRIAGRSRGSGRAPSAFGTEGERRSGSLERVLDEVCLRLEKEDEDRGEEAERRPAADRVPAAVRADPERGRDRRFGRVVGELVEVDARGGELLPPPRHFAVRTVEEELELDKRTASTDVQSPSKVRQRAPEEPGRDHERGDAVRWERRAKDQAGSGTARVGACRGARPSARLPGARAASPAASPPEAQRSTASR